MKYATVFWYGSSETICSWHKTLAGAEKAAKACEKLGGIFHHEIWEVKRHKRARR